MGWSGKEKEHSCGERLSGSPYNDAAKCGSGSLRGDSSSFPAEVEGTRWHSAWEGITSGSRNIHQISTNIQFSLICAILIFPQSSVSVIIGIWSGSDRNQFVLCVIGLLRGMPCSSDHLTVGMHAQKSVQFQSGRNSSAKLSSGLLMGGSSVCAQVYLSKPLSSTGTCQPRYPQFVPCKGGILNCNLQLRYVLVSHTAYI